MPRGVYERAKVDVADRFWVKVNKSDGCWEWTAHRHVSGYGMINIDRVPRYAHRVAYEMLRGEIPDGLQLDHLCRNRGCVNPDHLEPVTNRENTLRGRCGEVNAARMRARTRCKSGHEFTADNTHVYIRNGRTTRHCRACRRATSRALYVSHAAR